MVDTKIILILLVAAGFNSCNNFEREKIVVNYQKGYLEILSDEYVIDSVRINDEMKNFYTLGLINKSSGTNKIFYKAQNNNYNVFKDSLDFYCSNSKINLPSLEIFIRKKNYIGTIPESSDTEIEFADYNQIPCGAVLVDTIETHSPKK